MTSRAAIGVPTEVLVAPDSFKGTFSARAVAQALQLGLAASGQPAQMCPLADGGEGTVAALAEALGLRESRARVSDPLGRELEASFGLA
ncbi:MAG: glycerate kinase, partial [Acidobacteriota bacterium]|nr:glycerate kinase [Acidobacteriota bacterium]